MNTSTLHPSSHAESTWLQATVLRVMVYGIVGLVFGLGAAALAGAGADPGDLDGVAHVESVEALLPQG